MSVFLVTPFVHLAVLLVAIAVLAVFGAIVDFVERSGP
jgi:hypothetical protein